MDPAKSQEPHLVGCAALDLARRSHGTDEDLILIPWEQPARRKTLATHASAAASAAA